MNPIENNHLDYLKKQHAFASRRVSVTLHIVYENTGLADVALAKALQKDGVKKTLERIEKNPQYFGKLKGRMFLGAESKERENAKAMIGELKYAVEREYLLRLQFREAQRLKQIQEVKSEKSRDHGTREI